MFFGLFHLHRIWGLIDRTSYADFWLGILENKGAFYFVLMGILAFLCICGIVTFWKNKKNKYWWRWIYIFGGSYVLFDLFAIAIELKVWNDLLLFMFDPDPLLTEYMILPKLFDLWELPFPCLLNDHCNYLSPRTAVAIK